MAVNGNFWWHNQLYLKLKSMTELCFKGELVTLKTRRDKHPGAPGERVDIDYRFYETNK